jgi:hypothetical protein
MTRKEWLACRDPEPMLQFLRAKASGRRLRLFACACCRRLPDHAQESWKALDVAERYADSELGERELIAAWGPASRVRYPAAAGLNMDLGNYAAAAAAAAATPFWDSKSGTHVQTVLDIARNIRIAIAVDPDWEPDTWKAEESAQADLLRDIFGDPFQPVALGPSWRTSAVLALARAAYGDRPLRSGTLNTTRLAILADALVEAGCGDADILGHVRGAGPHVRGCWVLDLVLGKE